MNKMSFLAGCILGLSCAGFAFSAYARAPQETSSVQKSRLTVSGVVVDDEGEPLPGVALRVDGTDEGAQTDLDGRFTIRYVPDKNVTLTFFYLGMADERITLVRNGEQLVPDRTELKVKMKSDTEDISEAVVTGYGTISKQSFTGSATTVTRQEILKAAPQNAFTAMQIFDPSFKIMENVELGSNPNAIPEMTVRGQSGIGVTDLDEISSTSLSNNPNLPTFILDGFEVSVEKIYDLDVNRIESMTLLKDAAATAMYGSRAANGVMVITTVAPRPGKVNVSYSLDLTLQTPDLSYYNMMDVYQKLEAEKIAGLFTGKDPDEQITLDKEYNEKLQEIERGVNTDWMRLPLRNSLSHKHSLYVDGGEGSLRYGVDFMYNGNNGVMKGSSRETFSGGVSLSYNYKNLNIRNYVSFQNVKAVESPYGTYSDFVKMNPYDTYLDEYGNIRRNMKQWDSNVQTNPMYDATLSSFDRTSSKEFRDNFEVRWNITKHLNLRAGISAYYDASEQNVFRDPDETVFDSISDQGDLRITENSGWGYDINTLLYYNEVIRRHHLNLSFGFNLQETENKYVSSYYVGFPKGGFSSPEFAEELRDKPTTSTEAQRLFGTLLMLNYSYDNIYLLDVSGRVDGSSQFGAKRKYAPFASAGVGLNIHNYDIVRSNLPWLTQLKLRTSFGQTGKTDFPSYTAQDKFFVITDSWFPTGSSATLNYMGNPNLKWETTNTFEFGGELTLFDNILYLKVNRYYKQTKDLIADMTIPSSSGFTSYKENVGEVSNRGWEINLRTKIYDTRSSMLYLFANFAHNRNRLEKISDSMRDYNERVDEYFAQSTLTNDKPVLKYYEGASLTSIYGMKSLGIDPATGREMFQYSDGSVGYTWAGSENVVIGDTEADVTGSFGANFYWKGFTIDAYFSFSYGGQIYNSTLLDKVERADPNYNCDVRVITDRWTQPGDVSAFKSLQSWRSATQPTSRFVQDYNWLKLSSLSIGYEVPQKYISRAKISRLKFQLNCSDLFTVSTIQMEKGTSYPFARAFDLTASITF